MILSALKEKDIWTIKEVVDHFRKNPSEKSAMELAIKTKEVVQKKLGAESELNPIAFLDFVLKDYNYIHKY